MVVVMKGHAHNATKTRNATGVRMVICSPAQLFVDEERS
jgi:hypothetical protein